MSRKIWIGGMLGLLVGGSLIFQAYHFYRFVNAGPRFTAKDGQELCERVSALERESFGFQQSGKIMAPCVYMK